MLLFLVMVSLVVNCKVFIQSSIQLVFNNSFDGFDLDWEFLDI